MTVHVLEVQALIRAVLETGERDDEFGWHTQACWGRTGVVSRRKEAKHFKSIGTFGPDASCVEECAALRQALRGCGGEVD